MRLVAIIVMLTVALISFGAALVSKTPRVRRAAWWLVAAMLLGSLLAWWILPLTDHLSPPRG